MWARPSPKSLTTVRLAHDFNQVVQWDILFHRKQMVSHLLDEAIRWTVGSLLKGRKAEDLIEAIMTHWIRHFGPMKVLVADGETGLCSEEVAQFLDRVLVQLKTKAPGEHAQMVERHHELLRKLLLRVESQLLAEGLNVPFEVILAECILAKNVLTTVAGQTPYRALYGREPPGLAEFEPQSETVLDDHSGGVAGHSRDHHRVREMALAAMVQESAQMRLERALNSKTRLAVEQLELQPGDLVDFWRKPATKDESGWRGPARVVELGNKDGDESSATTVKWQGRSLQVRTQDLRRALVYLVHLAFPTIGTEDPRDLVVTFAESLQRGQQVRIGWVRIDMSQSKANANPQSGTSVPAVGWLRAKHRRSTVSCWSRLCTWQPRTSAWQAASAHASDMGCPPWKASSSATTPSSGGGTLADPRNAGITSRKARDASSSQSCSAWISGRPARSSSSS